MTDFHLIWTSAGQTLKGYDQAAGVWEDQPFSFGPLFAGSQPDWKTFFVTTSCTVDRSDYYVSGLNLSVDADADTLKVLRDLAATGFGLQVSFDEGQTYSFLTDTPVPVTSAAFISNLGSTVLRPYDSVRIQLRVSLPPDFSHTGKFTFRIAADFEVL